MNIEDDDYFSSNDEDIPSQFNIIDKIIDKINDDMYIVKLTAREIVDTSNWCYNREINDERVQELYDYFINNVNKNDNMSPIWMFQAIYDSKSEGNKIYILDGQHRKKVLTKYLLEYDENMNFNATYYCTIYNINYCESVNKKKAIELFKKINNNRQFKEEELPDDFIAELVDVISYDSVLKFGIKIKDNNDKAQEPCIHKKELNTLFNINKEKIKNMTFDEILINLKKINNRLSLKDYKELYGNKGKKKETYHNKAKQLKFYLNLKTSKYPSSEWIKFIDKPNDI